MYVKLVRQCTVAAQWNDLMGCLGHPFANRYSFFACKRASASPKQNVQLQNFSKVERFCNKLHLIGRFFAITMIHNMSSISIYNLILIAAEPLDAPRVYAWACKKFVFAKRLIVIDLNLIAS